MKDLKEKVAVVTGAASGIGRGIAERCVQEGMKVVLADIEEPLLAHTANELKATGARVLAVRTDVSNAGDVEALAHKTLQAFGAVHVLCNNAGVAVPGPMWDLTVADWEWVLGVNLWGVIHGVRVFVPIMLTQASEGHVVNTASSAGLTTGTAAGGPYPVSKHAVVALSEVLSKELQQAGARVKVSVLCPGAVRTKILDAARNRPASLEKPRAIATGYPDWFKARVEAGSPPAMIAEQVLAAVRDERFYILPHPAVKERVRARMEDILAERNPGLE
jgi:NAD(P)-dependent dehydrogenase (short-subunit alcohol dehydrogenase family)